MKKEPDVDVMVREGSIMEEQLNQIQNSHPNGREKSSDKPSKMRRTVVKSLFAAPAILAVGTMPAFAGGGSPCVNPGDILEDDEGKSGKKGKRGKKKGRKKDKGRGSCGKGGDWENNGHGNGDQDAPGNSCEHNNAENANCGGGSKNGNSSNGYSDGGWWGDDHKSDKDKPWGGDDHYSWGDDNGSWGDDQWSWGDDHKSWGKDHWDWNDDKKSSDKSGYSWGWNSNGDDSGW